VLSSRRFQGGFDRVNLHRPTGGEAEVGDGGEGCGGGGARGGGGGGPDVAAHVEFESKF